ncbi:MAG: hypothetical protein QNK05_07335 [Myxococcota bacterium]|nr:hypothetical protein [Myxococcota bacterium]
MSAMSKVLAVALASVVAATWAGSAWAQQSDLLTELFGGFGSMEGVPDDIDEPFREFVDGFAAFGNLPFMLQELLSLMIAVGLGGLIAFFPREHPPATADEYQRPRAIVMYALVGAVVAELVLFNPPMAFVVFGIGGLMRFRSVVGNPRDTARAILAAVVGLACGLKLFPLAALATLFYWGGTQLFWVRTPVRLAVRKLDPERVPTAAGAWLGALEARGCQVPHLRIREGKSRIEMLVLVPMRLDPERLLESLDLPLELRGSADWELQ